MHEAATNLLIEALGEKKVRRGDAERFAASLDNIKLSFPPDAVIFPTCDNDVATTLRLANLHGVPVTVRGSGTSTTGAATPVCGGWAMSFAEWADCEIEPDARIAVVRPGAITQKINDLAAKFGLFFPPDPASVKHCTIGGNVATNAGGLRAAKYGVTRDYVLALEGFLPTGEKVRWGAATKKFAAGYDLRDLWIGAEGTLGVVTKIVLRLVPLPEARRTFLCAFSSDEAALNAACALMRERFTPSVLEFMDALSIDCARAEKTAGGSTVAGGAFSLLTRGDSVLLVENDGDTASVESQAGATRKWARDNARAFLETGNAAEAETLWEVRRACSPAMFRIADSKLNEDVVVPQKNYLALLAAMREVSRETGLATPIFGHAADGNFHVHIMYNRSDAQQRRLAQRAVAGVMRKVVDLGGAISGEHGIGLAKSPFFQIQHSPAEIAAMRAIKRALDPNDILGRGKIFEPFNVWDHAPADVKLPWESR